MITIKVHGMDAVMRVLDPNIARYIQGASIAVAKELERRLKVYPKLEKGRVVRWKSERQRRFYHAMRRARGLPAKYTRQSDPMSERLKTKWQVSRLGALGAKVENGASYGIYVQADEYQQPMHRDAGWTTDRQAADRVKADGTIERIFSDAMEAIVRR